MPEAGFEPAPPKRPELKSGALDHSAIQALKLKFFWILCPKMHLEGLEPSTSGS